MYVYFDKIPTKYWVALFVYIFWALLRLIPQIQRLNDIGRSRLYVLLPLPFALYTWYLLFSSSEDQVEDEEEDYDDEEADS